MGNRTGNIPDISRLIRGLLDANYERIVSPVLRSIAANHTTGAMKTRMDQLEAELARLAEAGEKLQIDNPVLAAWFESFEATLERDRELINSIAAQLQAGGIDAAEKLTPQITFNGLPASVRAAWNMPDPEAVAAAVDFVNKPAWGQELTKINANTLGVSRNVVIRGIATGRPPLATAADLRRLNAELTVAQARTITRTGYLASYRQAAAINQLENSNILEKQIRVAVLDERTCMACVIQNGDVLEIGEVVKDHQSGRCTSVAIVKGYPRTIQSGQAWFEKLPESQQRSMMGQQAFDDWSDGKFSLRDFIHPYRDDVFGEMVRQASLKEIYLKKGY